MSKCTESEGQRVGTGSIFFHPGEELGWLILEEGGGGTGILSLEAGIS